MLRRPFVLLARVVLACLAIAPTMRAQETKEARPRQHQELFEQHQGDFDYLVGDWRFTARNSDYGEFTGVWSAVKLATGNGGHVLDEYRITGENGETYFVPSTLRVYNPAIDRWELVSVTETSGLDDRGTALTVGNEMHVEQTFGGTRGSPEKWRIRYLHSRRRRPLGCGAFHGCWKDLEAAHDARGHPHGPRALHPTAHAAPDAVAPSPVSPRPDPSASSIHCRGNHGVAYQSACGASRVILRRT